MDTETRARLQQFRLFVENARATRADFKQPNYTSPVWLATAQAICLGLNRLTCIEFGVAQGRGLISLIEICRNVTIETGIEFEIFGFDTTTGLPPPIDYRDHPEIWHAGEYALANRDALVNKLPPHAHLVVGDVYDTVPKFLASQLSAPIGFVSVDLDFYSGTVAALNVLRGPVDRYLPACMMYFDDVDGLVTLNEYCGEELAIKEFNERSATRKIQRKTTRTPKSFVCHVLDHPVRTGAKQPLIPLEIPASLFS